jgi:hypothetical protein
MLDGVLDREIEAGERITEKGRPAERILEPKQHDYEEIWLLGQPPLSRFLEFVEDAVVDGENADRAALTEEWRSANDYYQQLEKTEAGIANQAQRRELDRSLATLVAQVKAHSWYRNTFSILPTAFGMVELDRLIVGQKHVMRDFVDALQARIGPAPDPAALFRFCLPLEAPAAPVEIRRVGSRRYVFRCGSTDLRFHEPTLLCAEQAPGYESFGMIAGIVGLVVGFGGNFLNVIRVGNRLLLNNGYHRACALRALGITHAPCAIQTATRTDEVGLVSRPDVAEDPEFYFESARPPLLKDYFDPKIRKLLPVHKRVRQIEVHFDVKNYLVHE